VKASNYYAGRYETTGALVTVTRSGRTKLLDPRYDLWNHSPTGFAWGYAGSGPAQLALAILADYFGAKPGGKAALANALYQSFKFAVIVALPQECEWKMSFEDVGITLCRLLTDKQDLFSRTISSLESAVYEKMFSRQGEEESLVADFSEAAIAERLTAMLSEAFPMSQAFAGSLVERYYAGLHTQQHT